MKPERSMADGPRCKRRKQANPRRKNVLQSYESVIDAGSETDEEDCLQIAEDGAAPGPPSPPPSPSSAPAAVVAAAVTAAAEAEARGGEEPGMDGQPGSTALAATGAPAPTHGGAVGFPSPDPGAVLREVAERGGVDVQHTWRSRDAQPSPHYNGLREERVTMGPEAILKLNRELTNITSVNHPSEFDNYFARQKKCAEGDGQASSIAEFLRRSDTAVIYPEAPEDPALHQGTPEHEGPAENDAHVASALDAFSQLLACPYCDRGYKRLTSLKEHIRYRHEGRAEGDAPLVCPLCPGSAFATRAQLDRHTSTHARQQDVSAQNAGHRKFKCGECGKAFKYKHHLKEHLRIHSGEKPYECPNCKKRFSHSGSYSSHISSKKCIGQPSPGGAGAGGGRSRAGPRAGTSPSTRSPTSPDSQALSQLRQKLQASGRLSPERPGLALPSLPEAVCVKSEPLTACDFFSKFRTTISASPVGMNGNGGGALHLSSPSHSNFQHLFHRDGMAGVLSGREEAILQNLVHYRSGSEGMAETPQAVLCEPAEGTSLSEVKKVLQIVDNTVTRLKVCSPVREEASRPPPQPFGVKMEPDIEEPQMTMNTPKCPPISLPGLTIPPFLARNGTAMSIIDYTLEKVNEAKACLQGLGRDPSGREQMAYTAQTLSQHLREYGGTMDPKMFAMNGQKFMHQQDFSPESFHSAATPTTTGMYRCQFCGQGFPGPIPLHQHERYMCKMNEEIKAVLVRPEPRVCNEAASTYPGIPTSSADPAMTTQDKVSLHSLMPEGAAERMAFLREAYRTRNVGEPITAEMLTKFSMLVPSPVNFMSRCHDKPSFYHIPDPAPISQAMGDLASSGNGDCHLVQKASPRGPPPAATNESKMRSPPRQAIKPARFNLPSRVNHELCPGSGRSPFPLNLSAASFTRDSNGDAHTPNGHSHTPDGNLRSTSNGSSLSSEDNVAKSQAEPLDLSLPKLQMARKQAKKRRREDRENFTSLDLNSDSSSPYTNQDEPLNLAFLKKELGNESEGYNEEEAMDGHRSDAMADVLKPLFGMPMMYGAKPPLHRPLFSAFPPVGAFQPHAGLVPPPTLHSGRGAELAQYPTGLEQLAFFPQLAYTAFPPLGAASLAELQLRRKYQRKANSQAESLDGDYGSDSDTGLPRKKLKKAESGNFSCDLCDKTFQKSSSLLRHKYEHTGKRPHQCEVCNKAFKHKHHLIEHSRLHSGEKPYRCDRCGKRFSHSGSYSQHMNHRYSYCRRGVGEGEVGGPGDVTGERATPPDEADPEVEKFGGGDNSAIRGKLAMEQRMLGNLEKDRKGEDHRAMMEPFGMKHQLLIKFDGEQRMFERKEEQEQGMLGEMDRERDALTSSSDQENMGVGDMKNEFGMLGIPMVSGGVFRYGFASQHCYGIKERNGECVTDGLGEEDEQKMKVEENDGDDDEVNDENGDENGTEMERDAGDPEGSWSMDVDNGESKSCDMDRDEAVEDVRDELESVADGDEDVNLGSDKEKAAEGIECKMGAGEDGEGEERYVFAGELKRSKVGKRKRSAGENGAEGKCDLEKGDK
ncbi:zinc finger E-box-binding homeobox 2 isoform X1 [Lampetra planeri]